MPDLSKNISLFLVASLSLGLAPFFPEPHIWGKLKWIAGGAKGMQAVDWFDTLMHGTPWILLIIASVQLLQKKRAENKNS